MIAKNCEDNTLQSSWFGYYQEKIDLINCETLEVVKREGQFYMTCKHLYTIVYAFCCVGLRLLLKRGKEFWLLKKRVKASVKSLTNVLSLAIYFL